MDRMCKRLIAGLGATALSGLALALAGTASADCRLTIQPTQDQWLIRYDAFTDEGAQRQFDVALVNQGDTACNGSIRIDLRGEPYGLSRNGEPERIPYALVDERSGNDVTPRAGQNARRLNARPVDIAPGERALVRFTFATATDAALGEGVYSQDAFISVDAPDGTPLAERPVALAINVVPTAVMGLKGAFQRSNGVARIEIGELTEGVRSLSTSLYVFSTGGYSVSVRSSNQGRLRLGSSEWYVAYGLLVDDKSMNLGQGDRFEVVSRRPRADDYALSVNIGDVRGKRAGNYTDVLTFTVAAL